MTNEELKKKLYRQLRAVRNSVDGTLRGELSERLNDQLIRTQQSIQAAMHKLAAEGREQKKSED